jgi:glycosyltransferase 2 family protein
MRKVNIKVIVQYTIFLGLGLGLVWYSGKDLSQEQIAQLKASLKQTRYLYILPVVGVMLLSHYSRSLRWIILMEPLGYKPGKVNTYLSVLIGYFFNLLMPRLGEVMKCTLLARYEKIAPDKLVGTIVAERAIDLLCLLAITAIMVLMQFDVIGQYTIDFFAHAATNKSGEFSWLKVLLIIGGTAIFIAVFRFLLHRLSHVGFVVQIKKVMAGIWSGLTTIRFITHKKAFVAHTITIWVLYLLGIWLGFMAFPGVSHLGIKASVSLLVFGSIGMIATQGGIGAYQIAVQKTLLIYGIGAVTGLAFGWVMWAAQTAIVLFSGVAAILILPWVNRHRVHATDITDITDIKE